MIPNPTFSRRLFPRSACLRAIGVVTLATFAGIVGSGVFSAPPVAAYTPESPEVQAMIEKGVSFLEKGVGRDQFGNVLGGKCLAALACYKHRGDANHPLVQEAIKACRESMEGGPGGFTHDFNYSLGIAVIFLCELNPQELSTEIDFFLGQLQSRQRSDGSWSYPNHETGDTSQTQYGVLSAWIASKQGFHVPRDSVEAFTDWLVRTQDPSGAFAYQARDPGRGNSRIRQDTGQEGLRLSMSPAALGSLYIAADMLGIDLKRNRAEEQQEIFAKVPTPEANVGVDVGRLRRALADGNDYFRRNFRIDLPRNEFYYLYSIERYETFREFAEGREIAEPDWYNAGVDYLSGKQSSDGGWNGTRGPVISTAFATLFLLRSTRQTVELVSDGALVGGRLLPSDLTKVKLVDGQVIGNQPRTDIGSLMELVESGESLDTDTMLAQLAGVRFGDDGEKKDEQLERLKQMVSGRNYQARLLAVRALSDSGDLENAPVLIYALGDGDPRVVREAHNGLRLLSRRLSVRQLPADPTPAQKRSAQDNWYQWLQGIRPDIEVPADAFLPVSARDES
jgi:hypothetical protein